MTETFDVQKAIEAQKKYCKDNNAPDFANLVSGNCWSCNRNIFQKGGISVEKASNQLITGCPFCHRSYCD